MEASDGNSFSLDGDEMEYMRRVRVVTEELCASAMHADHYPLDVLREAARQELLNEVLHMCVGRGF